MASVTPLAGITVVEIGHSVAAPFAGLVLAGLGARVIKVENPGHGDHSRGWGPPFWNGTAAAYLPYNRDKLGIAVDLADPVAAGRLKRLILDEADVLIQNLREGAAERFGLGSEALRAERPDLICCDIGAFGQGGPLSGKPGYDPLMQAFAGIMSVTGEHGRPPVRVGVSLVDVGSGMWSVIGILSALFERARTGEGATIRISLFETAVAWMAPHMAAYETTDEVRLPHGSGTAEIVPYQAFRTRDGWLMVAAGNDGLFAKLCRALGRPELADDPRFRANPGRVANRADLLAILEPTIAGYSLEELGATLDAFGIPNAPVQTIDALASHPQLAATGLYQRGPEDALPTVGLPLTFDGRRAPYRRRAPHLGEHNEEVFACEDLGRS